jgi:hypothetical protein
MAKPKIYQVDQLQTMVGSMNTAITAAHNQANSAYGAANTGGGPKIASIVYPGNDTAANNIGGQTVYLTGSGFYSNSSIYINGNSVPATSFISASNIGFTTPNLTNGIYPIYLVNYDGATAIKVPGIVISGEPSWNTAAGSLSSSQAADGAWSYSLSANGDAPITYALASGSTLPTGVSLNANGVISGTISSPPGVDTTYTFSVVASDAQNQDATRQFSVTATVGEGVLFANNVLLLHADGTNNGNNHAFLDSSNNNFSITRYGNATQGTFSPFSQTGWSNFNPDSSNGIGVATNAALNMGTGDFTVEAWVNTIKLPTTNAFQTSSGGYQGIFGTGPNNSASGSQLYIGVTNLFFDISSDGSGPINVAHNMIAGQWYHIAITRSGNTFRAFINGVLVQTATSSGSWTDGYGYGIMRSEPIGGYNGSWWYGYVSNFRVTKGGALYTGNFTPSTTPLTTTVSSGTVSLLTCQSNRFIDNSSNAFTISVNGSPSVQAFSPFAPTAAYTTANVGGSMYLDGTGDYIGATSGISTQFSPGSAFTFECWLYPTAFPAGSGQSTFFVVMGTTVDWSTSTGILYQAMIYSSTLYWQFQTGGAAISISGTAPPINQWTHYAVGFNGTTTRLWINGVSVGTSTSAYTVPSYSNFELGAHYNNTSYAYTGYISNARFIKGVDLYGASNSTITVPTAPLTSVANTQLLLNFTNAQIFDQTAKNVLECIGDAKVSTTQYKYGTGSMYFDGTGDYITAYNPNLFLFGTSDFTAEAWVYPTSFPSEAAMITTAHPTDQNGFTINVQGSTGNIILALGSGTWTVLVSSGAGTLTTNNWQHIALTRSGNVFRFFINGTQTYTVTNSLSLTNPNNLLTVGGRTPGSGQYFNGYIDDLRITRGYARYTSNFTPPAAAFQNK